ncbi:hypothetical protein [Neorhizobium tomejilense]|uniref:hypothetical protein n=1 Tax=Neorhizobium tomejilense TaxID=2093828 RepID=UPI003ECFFCE2
MLDLGIGSYLKLSVAAIIVAAVAFVAFKYHSISSELSEAKASLVHLEGENARLVDISNRNAEAALKADADRIAAVEALEYAQGGVEVNTKTSRLAESSIDAAPAADDGDVSPLLEALRKSRFGGGK